MRDSLNSIVFDALVWAWVRAFRCDCGCIKELAAQCRNARERRPITDVRYYRG